MGKMYGNDFSQTTISRFEALNLSSCGLASVAPGSLDSLQSLASLDLGYNQLASVPTSRLAGLASLASWTRPAAREWRRPSCMATNHNGRGSPGFSNRYC